MKVIAFYLPQYHCIPENDEWWGKGFTEWTNTKKAKQLFKGHNQPRVPLNENYYNLLDDNVKKWQIDLAKEYGIYGFCYYHYWFNGKQLLEQPMEQFLKNTNLDFPFCISWANEPWTRSWDGLTSEVIMPQEYSKEDAYIHFQYLLKFFNDNRYIKIDNKPLLLIYKLASMPNNGSDLIQLWNDLAKKNGFDGIYFVETLNGVQKNPVDENTDAALYFEPSYTVHHDLSFMDRLSNRIRNVPKSIVYGKKYFETLNYNMIWNKIIKRKSLSAKRTFKGCFIDWDNTARKGEKAMIFNSVSPEKFGLYFKKLIQTYDEEFIFINAWNEWAEGTYLEPDCKNKFRYLEEVRKGLHK
ncbi:glycosyltransferase WbsX family protein [Longibaculum muris]|uniref:glycosyltransferase WbsX family protein n=1 Tax=Longibaculum muris TaxID=1796628 RepID=UPI0022E3BF50|nr:glycoside hydrolase family 99-like domain-containing protein [Longibaculum muris]